MSHSESQTELEKSQEPRCINQEGWSHTVQGTQLGPVLVTKLRVRSWYAMENNSEATEE